MPARRASSKARPAGLWLPLLLYNLCFPFVFLLMLPGFISRMIRRGKYRHKFGQRFGIYSDRVRERLASHEWIWVHAVSVGEVLIALKLASKMRELQPDLHLVLSTTTSTGFALASKSESDWLEVIYTPLDLRSAVRRALNLIRPKKIVLVEAEVWPNLVSAANKRGIPVALVNARLSPRSENRFRRFRFFTAPIFQLLEIVCVQETDDVKRWQSLGVHSDCIDCTGSIKFDHTETAPSRAGEFRELLDRLGVEPDAPILLAGSTFPGEEEILARLFVELRPHFPDLFLIIVPRHVERTPEIVQILEQANVRFVLRTAIDAQPGAKVDCLLVNTTGELRDWYHVGTVIFIGKSLTATGGQNPVEAVMAGKPVLFGPHMENFAAIVNRWLSQDAAIQVPDAAALKIQIARLIERPLLRETMSAHARAAVAVHQGATARTARKLEAI